MFGKSLASPPVSKIGHWTNRCKREEFMGLCRTLSQDHDVAGQSPASLRVDVTPPPAWLVHGFDFSPLPAEKNAARQIHGCPFSVFGPILFWHPQPFGKLAQLAASDVGYLRKTQFGKTPSPFFTDPLALR